MWAVGQNCHLAGPSPVSLPRETPFAPTSLLGIMKWGGNHRVGGSHLQILCPPRANARLGKMVWQSHCHHKVSCYQAVSLGFLWPLRGSVPCRGMNGRMDREGSAGHACSQ